MDTIKIKIAGMRSTVCAATVERALSQVPGVDSVLVDIEKEEARIRFTDGPVTQEILYEAVASCGFKVILSDKNGQEIRNDADVNIKKRIRHIGGCLAVLIVLELACFIGNGRVSISFLGMMAVAEVLFGSLALWQGYFLLRRGLSKLVAGVPSMDSLASLACSVAFFFSVWRTVRIIQGFDSVRTIYFAPATALLLLLMVDEYYAVRISMLEDDYASNKNHTRDTFVCRILLRNQEYKVSGEDVFPKDLVIAESGETIVADGTIIQGRAAIDESALTDVTMPVNKGKGDKVFAGSIILSGKIIFRVSHAGDKTYIRQLENLAEDIPEEPLETIFATENLAIIFLPAVLSLCVIVALSWYFYSGDSVISWNVLTVLLLAACPGALGMSILSALYKAISEAEKKGVLFKNTAVLEQLHKVSMVALAKTGLLTEGKMRLECVVPREEDIKNTVMKLAAVLTKESKHPLGESLKKTAYGKDIFECEISDYVPGSGVSAWYRGSKIAIGDYNYIKKMCAIPEELKKQVKEFENKGSAVFYLSVDGKWCSIFVLSDVVRPRVLDEMGNSVGNALRFIIITGDGKNASVNVGNIIGISQVAAELAPKDKAELLGYLRRSGEFTAMVGGGISDAPALAASCIGVTTLKSAEAASARLLLPNKDLKWLWKAMNLSRQTVLIIKQNLFLAFFFNILYIAVIITTGVLWNESLVVPLILTTVFLLSWVGIFLNVSRLRYSI
ncbi:MAG: HAD-IC family P-type ATPase [Phascolarctobacterium sp.]|nr:HAD-IC family P-type ATPase [Phascolarctobacterium sp.]